MSPRFRIIIAASLAAAGACASDEPPFPDGGGGGGGVEVDGGGTTPAVCGAPFGSCTQLGGAASDEYSGDIPADVARMQCEEAGNTYASGPCNTAGTVGGCRFDLPDGIDGMGRWCTTTWQFPPTTTANVMQACVTPGVYVPPP